MHVEGVPWEGVMGAITFGFYLKQFFFFFLCIPLLIEQEKVSYQDEKMMEINILKLIQYERFKIV